ncbi:Uncharacterised protein [Legionella hackeliae]|nr:hypothetical protein Lhac_1032 [Legionella hackeliae]STX48294.1 Uncharacterised protein [Legionella hackeliae]
MDRLDVKVIKPKNMTELQKKRLYFFTSKISKSRWTGDYRLFISSRYCIAIL